MVMNMIGGNDSKLPTTKVKIISHSSNNYATLYTNEYGKMTNIILPYNIPTEIDISVPGVVSFPWSKGAVDITEYNSSKYITIFYSSANYGCIYAK